MEAAPRWKVSHIMSFAVAVLTFKRITPSAPFLADFYCFLTNLLYNGNIAYKCSAEGIERRTY